MLPVNNYVLDFKTSCTREEAVGKMLGWLRGPIRWDPEFIETLDVSEELLTYTPNLTYSLKDYFDSMREVAISKVVLAFDSPDASEDDKKLATEELFKCDELIIKAAKFLICIDDELAKGGESALRLDHQETNKIGEVQITLKSLDEWATENFKISILDEPNVVFDRNSFMQLMPRADAIKELSKTKSENLYTTFGFLIDAFVADKGKQFIKNDRGEVNVNALAERLADDARKANRNENLPGQSAESIKSRIEKATKIKKSNLPSS